MLDYENKVKLDVDRESSILKMDFQPVSAKTIYDICDFQGRILKTGEVVSEQMRIDIAELKNDQYILLILDGNRVFTERFQLG